MYNNSIHGGRAVGLNHTGGGKICLNHVRDNKERK